MLTPSQVLQEYGKRFDELNIAYEEMVWLITDSAIDIYEEMLDELLIDDLQ